MKIETILLKDLRPAPYNPREIDEATLEKLKGGLTEFGCVEPLVVNADGTIIGGHQRWEAARQLGWTSLPCVRVDLTDAQAKTLNLALNRISGDWDTEKLSQLLGELTGLPAFDVGLTGFDLPEVSELLDRLLPSDGEDDGFDVEAALEAIEEPVTQPGELIDLGPHRLLCGDSTRAEDVARLMDGRKAQLVFTDPPYGVNYRGGRVGKQWAKKIRQDGEKYWDEMSDADYAALLTAALEHARDFSDEKAPLYLWFASAKLATVVEALETTDWAQRNLLVWVKNVFAGSLYAQYKHQYEPCVYGFKRGKSPRWFGPTNETTVWHHDKPSRNEGHPTVKPLALAERAIRNSSCRDDLVLDLFLGSGTTLIAAERLGRTCCGMELQPRYCDLVIQRWETLTGREAKRRANAR